MNKWSISCRIKLDQKEQIQWQLADFSGLSGENGYYAVLKVNQEQIPCEGYVDATVTIFMDDEYIKEKQGAKRGPKNKETKITVEEMARLKDRGVPPKEIAELAGIGIATYFRRMAAYKEAKYMGNR